MTDLNSIQPLLDIREKLEQAIAGYLDRVAALRKRHDAINTAINVLKSSDDTVLLEAPRRIRREQRVDPSKQDPVEKVEADTKQLLSLRGKMSRADIMEALRSNGTVTTRHRLEEVMRTSPDIVREGERNATVYRLK